MEVREPNTKYLVEPAYKQTEVGVIPADWKAKQLGDFRPFVTSGSRGWAAYYSETGTPFIRITNLSRECIFLDLSDLRYVAVPESNTEGARTQLMEGDVLISITADIGIVGYVAKEIPMPSYINQHIALVRFDPSQTCPQFISYYLASENSQKRFHALTDSGAKAGMNLATVQQIWAAFPPTIAEQQAIAEALSDADALIESLDQLLAKKRQIKQGAMQELLTGQKRLPGFSGEWDETTLGEISERIVGGGTPSRNNPTYWNGDVPWMTVKDFACFSSCGTLEYITKEGLENSSTNLVPRGTLITSTRMALGKAVIFEVDVCINQDLKAVYFRKNVSPGFMYFWFQFNEPQISGLGSGSTVMGISLPELKKIPFLRPGHAEQTAIATTLTDLDAEIAALEARLAKARLLKQGMMQELLTGRIRLV